MNILHVVAGLPQAGGGLSELVPSFACGAAVEGHTVVIATVARETDMLSSATDRAQKAGVQVVRFAPSQPHFLYFSWAMLWGLRSWVVWADVVHIHSDWTFPVWWGCYWSLRLRKPFVMSPHGCLAPERMMRSAWKKRMAVFLFDRRFLRGAAVIHATSDAEQREIAGCCQHWGFRPPAIAVVPSGVDVAQRKSDRSSHDRKGAQDRDKRMVLFLGRLDPLKGLDVLVKAWACVAPLYADWHLVIAGPDERGYAAHVKAQITERICARTTVSGPVYGGEKQDLLQKADVFVLPSYNENFGIAVAEALSYGVPVITTKGAPWSELLGNPDCNDSTDGLTNFRTNELTVSGRCGWWVDIGVEPLIAALKEAMGLTDEERHTMGENGRRLVESRYSWPKIAVAMDAVYREALQKRA